jgi:hypothetical protein
LDPFFHPSPKKIRIIRKKVWYNFEIGVRYNE